MTHSIYFSFIVGLLSFISVKEIQKVGEEHYHFIQAHAHTTKGDYNFDQPIQIVHLPFELREISGLVALSETEIACIQDENGIIFVYDLENDTIVRHYNFGGNGDYEGLTIVDSTFYVLRSDATLHEIQFPWDSTSVQQTKLSIPTKNNEGLCYDKKDNRLLVAPKSKLGKGQMLKDLRVIYAIDIASKSMGNEPLFTIQLSEIESFAKQKNIPLPQKLTKQVADSISALKFLPSCLAVHPVTDEIFVISAVDYSLAIFKKDGKLLHYQRLDPTIFNKAEGITFLDNGDLLITNEGQMGLPSLVRINWEKNINK